LTDAAHDVVAWGFDFYCYPFSFETNSHAVDHCIASARWLHADLVVQRAIVAGYRPL
jgi:hypothetical protein